MSTLTTEEHLNRILAKCKSLLETARKRTPGEWPAIYGASMRIAQTNPNKDLAMTCDDCRFIASCAGPAEAGWEATIAAIEYIRSDAEIFGENTPRGQAARSQLNAIIAAWPEELLS